MEPIETPQEPINTSSEAKAEIISKVDQDPSNYELIKVELSDRTPSFLLRNKKSGATLYRQDIAERMLNRSTKQFDRYCKETNPPVEKVRHNTGHYSHMFILDVDIHRIAAEKNLKISDPNFKESEPPKGEKEIQEGIDSFKQHVTNNLEDIIKEKAPAVFQNRINALETVNTELNKTVLKLTEEKFEIEKKTIIIENEKVAAQKSSSIKTKVIIFLIIGLGAGGGWGYLQYHQLDKSNDKVLSENDTYQKENTKLQTMVQDLQDQYQSVLKKLTPVVQNEEINAVKKD